MTAAGLSREIARRRLAAEFAAAGIASADLDARLLLCAAAGVDHIELIRRPDEPLGRSAEVLAGFAMRRRAGEPVSRILGRREFWGLSIEIAPAVLDPRPETEGLVAAAIDAIGGRRSDRLALLDLGTGSGAILAALLQELRGATAIGTDRSEAACHVAARNLSALGLRRRATIVCGDWAAALACRFDLVVSNPPYIATKEIEGLEREVRDHDPRAALDGGRDGLDAFRAILPAAGRLLRPAGVLAFECGTGQGGAVVELMRAAGCVDAKVYLDLAGHDRVVIGTAASSCAEAADRPARPPRR